MGFCGKCGSKIEDGDTFCPICGEKIILPEPEVVETPAALLKKARAAKVEETESAPKYGKDEDVFVDPDEHLIRRMGNGWITNILALRKLRRVCAILTDKRCYVQGNMYTTNGKDMVQMRTEKTVNVEDVNATGFEYTRSIKMMVFAIIFTILTIAGSVLAVFFIAEWGDPLIGFLIGQLWMIPLSHCFFTSSILSARPRTSI